MREEKKCVRSAARGVVRDERGLSTVEYIIILVLIAVAGIGLWRTFGDTVSEKISSATSEVEGL
jgi:Flp pilus assembly pilin Flp